MDPIDRRMMLGAAGLAGVAAMTKLAGAGPLNPPAGPVGPTGQTLDDIYNRIARTNVGVAEPRIPVQSLPGSATAVHVISEPGSYYLTGNIVGEAGKNGIEIHADDVSLDLCGFELGGVPGSLDGIILVGLQRNRSHILNGTIHGFGGCGVNGSVMDEASIHDLLVTDCGGPAAIQTNTGAIVRNCVLRRTARGVRASNRALIVDCVATDCGNHGFYLVGNGLIHRCSATFCARGIWIEFEGLALECYVSACIEGIVMNSGSCCEASKASDCGVAYEMGGSGNSLRNCSASGGQIIVAGTGNLLSGNIMRDAAGFSVAPGNSHGPIVNVAGVGDIAAIPGANHPWANFIF